MTSVAVTIEGKEYQLDELSFDILDEHLVDWHIGGITDPLGQLVSWLWEQISSAFEALESAVWGFLTTVRDQITSAVSSFVDSAVNTLSSLISAVSSAVESLSASISDFINQVLSAIDVLSSVISAGIAEISQAVSGIVDSVVSAVSSALSAFEDVISGLVNQMLSAVNALSSLVSAGISQLINALSSGIQQVMGYITQIGETVWGALQGFGQLVATYFTQLANAITSGIQQFISWVSAGIAEISGYISGAVEAFQKGFNQVITFFADLFKKIQDGISSVQTVLAGFVNPLANIWTVLTQMYKSISEFLQLFTWDNISRLFTEDIPSAFISVITQQIPQMISTLISMFKQYVIEPAKDIIQSAVAGVENTLRSAVSSIVKAFVETLAGFRQWFSMSTPPVDPSGLISSLMSVAVPFILAGINVGILADVLQTEVQVLGNEASLRLRAVSNILSSFFSGEAYIMPLMWTLFQATVFPAFSMWFNYNYTPRMPDVDEALDWYYWGKIQDEEFKTIARFLGYSSEFADVLLDTSVRVLSETDLRDIYWRLSYYGKLSNATIRMALPEREVQISLADFKGALKQLQDSAGIINVNAWFKTEMRKHRYTSQLINAKMIAEMRLPSVSDLITFVVREIITPEDFFTACQMQGLHAYWASAIYEAHWRLPSFGDLQEAFWRGVISADEFRKYIIWHDYRPFPRPDISKSDVDIMMSLQWKLPTRIDTRWMAKHGLISFSQHKRLVQMEGYPDGDPYELGFNIAETVAKAEIINVVVDERTLWRNRLFDSYELGLVTEQELSDILSKGFSTTIDGVEFKVGFHPLEVKLMLEAVKRERANRLAEDTIDSLIEAYVYGAISYDKFRERLNQVVRDREVRKAIEAKVALRKLRYVISAVKSEAESAIDRWLYLYESGYATLEEVKKAIGGLVAKAGMSEEELEVILNQAEARRERWVRDKTYDHIRRLYQYGRIDKRQYEELMQKLGFPEDIRKLELEAQSWFITRYDDIAERAVDLYIQGRADWGTVAGILRKLGMSQDWIEKRRELAEIERVIYQLEKGR